MSKARPRYDILIFIRDHIDGVGCAPSRREIAAATGTHAQHMPHYLGVLRDHDYIHYEAGVARGIEVTKLGDIVASEMEQAS